MHDPLTVAFDIGPVITVWHREPGGNDSGTFCRRGWRWHVWHWRIQAHPVQILRRRLLTRCTWCGGRSSKADPVNVSHQWDSQQSRWWQGEKDLFHHECSSVHSAHHLCLCEDPLLRYGDFGQCQFCGKFRGLGRLIDDADRALAALPRGSRITDQVRPLVEQVWAERWARL